jgi:hypothetical protein
VEDARDGGGQEAIGSIVQSQGGPDEEQLTKRPWMERQRDLDGNCLCPLGRRVTRARERHKRIRVGGSGVNPGGKGKPARCAGVPGESQLGEPGGRLGAGRRFHFRGGQQVREGIEVIADPDAPLCACLQGRGAPSGERIQNHVARP